jgi:hypothetical protein
VLLGVIAGATFVMAVVQVCLVVFAARMASKVEALSGRFELEIRPLIDQATAAAGNAARVSSLAVAQMERADRAFADMTRRIDDTASAIQGTLLAPAREGRALLAAIGAAVGALREGRKGRRRESDFEDDDPLFIG